MMNGHHDSTNGHHDSLFPVTDEKKIIPVIDISALLRGDDELGCGHVTRALDEACRNHGFFYVTGHGVDPALIQRLNDLFIEFFQLPLEQKMKTVVDDKTDPLAGYIPLGAEVVRGSKRMREAYKFVTDVSATDERLGLQSGTVWSNNYPELPAELRPAVVEYRETCEKVAQIILEGLAVGLGLDKSIFRRNYTQRPGMYLFISSYPPHSSVAEILDESGWGVKEHTDTGLLTMIGQDNVGGLQLKTRDGEWIDATPLPGTFICNIGDMLEKLTGGVYRATPHRVKNLNSTSTRQSINFFVNPSASSVVRPPPKYEQLIAENRYKRWDGAHMDEFNGTWKEYVALKNQYSHYDI